MGSASIAASLPAKRIGWAFLFACMAASAADFTALEAQGFVSDYARALDAGSRRALEDYCRRIQAATGAELAIVILPSLQGEPVEDVANAMFRAWGVGQKSSNRGVMLLLALAERRSRLEVGYGLEPDLPDGSAGEILRAMRPALRENRLGEALLVAAERIGGRIASARGLSLDPAPVPPHRRARESVPWPLLLGGLAVLVLALSGAAGAARAGRRAGPWGGGMDLATGMLMGALLGRRQGYGGHGRGGFGGYDSGDSFGGFGGGDSGGGGASSSW